MSLVAYISGHGFGHFTRSEAVLERVAAAGVPVHLRTDQKALPLARRAPWAASVTVVDTGPGAVQQGPLAVDVPATYEALARHVAALPALVAAEVLAVRALGARAIYGDVPPVAFATAHAAGLPSVGLANFSWSWIYEGYEPQLPAFGPLVARLREAEGLATTFLDLPFAAGLEVFPRRSPLPLVVRAPTRTREAARALLPVPRGERRPVVILSFGGFGDALDLGEAARRNPDFFFVAFSRPRAATENLAVLDHDHGLPHQDLVLGADVVLGKPGYGTVAEAVAARRPFVITPRGDFREFEYLVRGIEESVPSAHVTEPELLEGLWSPAIARALAAPPVRLTLGLDGAAIAARHVLRVLGGAPRAV